MNNSEVKIYVCHRGPQLYSKLQSNLRFKTGLMNQDLNDKKKKTHSDGNCDTAKKKQLNKISNISLSLTT